MNNNYKNLYLKYKSKYLTLKSSFNNQKGGQLEEFDSFNLVDNENSPQESLNKVKSIEILKESDNNIKEYLEDLNKMRDEMEKITNKIREIEPEFVNRNIHLWGNKNQPAYEYIKQLENLINKFTKYLESNDIPIDYYNLDLFYIKEFVDSIKLMKNDLTYNKLNEKYQIRKLFYTIDETNYNEILDAILTEYNINNEKDIEKIFTSAMLGFNKNYIFGYMVLFRFLIKNKKQLSVIDNDISYLTFHSIYSSLNNSLNSEEYVKILINLISQYIKSFPIKKVIEIRNPFEFNKKYESKSELSFFEINEKIEIIDRYDNKNNVIIYKSGDVKSVERINLDDIKQIIYSLVRIPIYKSN
jgi:hypothetical protein